MDVWNGEVIQGPAERTVSASFSEIPVYLREGAIMPVHLNKSLQWGESMTDSRVPALVATIPTKEMAANHDTFALRVYNCQYSICFFVMHS